MAGAQPKHKVLGLVSGGKDSCFNLLHCVANGHDVVALATLTPEPGTDELDSHLYQSVGTDLPPLIAESMALPHYSRVIKGKSIAQGPEYGDRTRLGQGSGVEGDETEDLYLLLQDVLAKHPDISAISTGAILSTYQRLRIEHVAGRLGLVSLAYLWQAEQLPLLEQMRACGMEVILVKVAGVGLGADLVGKSLWDALPTLRKLERMYGSHPAGEGGEYETLTLSSPLTSSRLSIVDSEVIITDPEPNLVAYLKIRRAELVPKTADETAAQPNAQQLREMLGLPQSSSSAPAPAGECASESNGEAWLDTMGLEALEELQSMDKGQRWKLDEVQDVERDLGVLELGAASTSATAQQGHSGDATATADVRFAKRGRWFTISTTASSVSSGTSAAGTGNVGDQVRSCFDRITAHLASLSVPLSLPLHATHITLLLPSMSLFPLANAAYISYFGISPPSRATVAVPLPEDVGVRIEVVGYDDTPVGVQPASGASRIEAEGAAERRRVGGRSALHVQSLSYWAPANIGPYSQAITVNERIHIAGQIPLIPPTLLLPSKCATSASTSTTQSASRNVQLQATLAMQHVRKIITVLRPPSQTGGGWEGWAEGCVAWWALPTPSSSARNDAVIAERAVHEVEIVREAIRIWADQMSFDSTAPMIIVRALELPKGAEVEVQMNLHTGRRAPREQLCAAHDNEPDRPNAHGKHAGAQDEHAEEDEDDDEDEEVRPVYEQGRAAGIRWETYRVAEPSGRGSRRGSRAAVMLESEALSNLNTALSSVPGWVTKQAVAVRIYHLAGDEDTATIVSHHLASLGETPPCVTLVPVLDIHDRSGRPARLALDVFGM